jgi:tripartite-type tricarboxylate transporter receptor subunit TctC
VSLQHIRSGKLRALAVTTATRVDTLPDIPPMSDYLPGYQASAWFGIGTPRNTPTDIVERLNQEINAGLADAGIRARIAEQGGVMLPGAPAEFAAFFIAETEKWGRVIREANIKAEQ